MLNPRPPTLLNRVAELSSATREAYAGIMTGNAVGVRAGVGHSLIKLIGINGTNDRRADA